MPEDTVYQTIHPQEYFQELRTGFANEPRLEELMAMVRQRGLNACSVLNLLNEMLRDVEDITYSFELEGRDERSRLRLFLVATHPEFGKVRVELPLGNAVLIMNVHWELTGLSVCVLNVDDHEGRLIGMLKLCATSDTRVLHLQKELMTRLHAGHLFRNLNATGREEIRHCEGEAWMDFLTPSLFQLISAVGQKLA